MDLWITDYCGSISAVQSFCWAVSYNSPLLSTKTSPGAQARFSGNAGPERNKRFGVSGIGEITQDEIPDTCSPLTWRIGWTTLTTFFLVGLQEVEMDAKPGNQYRDKRQPLLSAIR
jgi:hypothetical protein